MPKQQNKGHGELTYAQKTAKTNDQPSITTKRKSEQTEGPNIEGMLQQRLKNQEKFEKRLVNLENKVKNLASKKNG